VARVPERDALVSSIGGGFVAFDSNLWQAGTNDM
jgi:hypothetical protein